MWVHLSLSYGGLFVSDSTDAGSDRRILGGTHLLGPTEIGILVVGLSDGGLEF